MAEQSLKEFYDSLIGASTNWHKIEHNWRDVACVFAFAVSGLYTFSGAVAGSFAITSSGWSSAALPTPRR